RERIEAFVEEGSLVFGVQRPSHPCPPPAVPVRMRNSCSRSGRTHRPGGSFSRLTSPNLLQTREELLGVAAEVGARAERDRALELGDGGVALTGPREQQPEVVPHRLAAREPRCQRSEAGEGRREVVLVEAADRGGDL